MNRFSITLALLFGLVCIEPSFGENLHPVTPVELSPVNMIDTRADEAVVQGAIELGYDDGRPGPRRDDPGPDEIAYDDQSPSTLSTTQNLWSRVIFTTNADFELWGARVMPLNQRGNDSPCQVQVYSEDQDNHDLDELLWEGTIQQLRRYNGDPDNDWHWIELDEDDRVVIEAGDDFSIMYGPAPGGDYNNAQEGDGWWNVWDGSTDVERSYFAVGDQPPAAHNQWRVIETGDLMIRANGEYQGDFVDLGVTTVYNAEEESERKWMTFLVDEKDLFAEIVNEGAQVEEFTVTFEIVNSDGDVVFEREIEVDGIDVEETITVECDEVWEVPMETGHYTVWVTVEADDDANDDNNALGMEQIVFDQEESRDTWIGYVGGETGNPTQWSVGNGWAVRIDHPGGDIPLWITALRVGISGAANLECPFSIHIFDLDAEPDENGGYDLGDPEWSGSGNVQQNQQWVTVELDEDDYVTILEGEGLVVTYYYVNGGSILNDAAPPIAGVSVSMPIAMMQSDANTEIYTHANAGDYAIQIQMSGPDHGGVLTGTVIEADDGSPIEDALVITSQDHRDRTDENGRFEFPFGPHGDFTLTVSKQGYNTAFIDDLHLEDDEELDLEIALLHPEFLPSRNDFSQELEPDMEYSIGFNVINRGDGPLSYLVERRLIGEANIDPWEIRDLVATEESLNDAMLNGVAFVDGNFYVSGGNNGQNNSKIYVLNREGELVGDFDQFHESRYGMRDLTWDGELIWGSDEGVIYGFDIDGNLVHTIEGQALSYRSLTWDPVDSVFWSAGITTVIQATNLDGEVVAQIQRPGGINLYGFSYWGEDPDGYNLYIFTRGDETPVAVYKVNLDNGDHQLVTELPEIEEGRAGGIFITNELDVFSWLFIGMVQSTDRLIAWQLEGRRDWFQINPDEGEIAADERLDFTLMLDATGLPPENVFRGELAFIHNADDGETILPVNLEIVEGEVYTFRILNLHIGWNTVSINLQPDDGDDIIGLMAPLVDENLLIMMKNGAGQFYHPEYNYNSIPGWFVHEGYQILMRRAGRLRLEGWSVLRAEPIDLHEGWNLVSYYPRVDVEATLALSGIVGNLIIAKDGYGNFYIPDWNFCNMGMMREFQGYYMNIDADDVRLIYRIREEEDEQAALREAIPFYRSVYDSPGKLPVHAVTGENMSMLVLADPPLQSRGGNNANTPPLRSRGGTKGGVNIGVYSGGKLVGSGVLQDGMCGIAVWGDDPSTSVIDGAVDGQPLEIRVLSDGGMFSAGYTVLSGETEYRADALAVIELDDSVAVPDEYAITTAYPNPFNNAVQIHYTVPEATKVKLSIYDITGREVEVLFSGSQIAGAHQIFWNSKGAATGSYVLRLESSDEIHDKKLVLIK